jgi:hypothetical protein
VPRERVLDTGRVARQEIERHRGRCIEIGIAIVTERKVLEADLETRRRGVVDERAEGRGRIVPLRRIIHRQRRVEQQVDPDVGVSAREVSADAERGAPRGGVALFDEQAVRAPQAATRTAAENDSAAPSARIRSTPRTPLP